MITEDDVKVLVDELRESHSILCSAVQMSCKGDNHAEWEEFKRRIHESLDSQYKLLSRYRTRPDPLTPTEKHIGWVCEFSDDEDFQLVWRGALRAKNGPNAYFMEGRREGVKYARILPICQLIPHDGSDRKPEDWDDKEGGIFMHIGEVIPVFGFKPDWITVKAYLPAKYIR